jgi:hypothetical protein
MIQSTAKQAPHRRPRPAPTRRVGVSLVVVLGMASIAACRSLASPADTLTPGASAAVPAGKVDAARLDAARRLGLAAGEIVVESAQAVTWADGSVGCPQPGVLYSQALVPGFRIVLRTARQRLEYHASADGEPFFCPPERVSPPAAGASPD